MKVFVKIIDAIDLPDLTVDLFVSPSITRDSTCLVVSPSLTSVSMRTASDCVTFLRLTLSFAGFSSLIASVRGSSPDSPSAVLTLPPAGAEAGFVFEEFSDSVFFSSKNFFAAELLGAVFSVEGCALLAFFFEDCALFFESSSATLRAAESSFKGLSALFLRRAPLFAGGADLISVGLFSAAPFKLFEPPAPSAVKPSLFAGLFNTFFSAFMLLIAKVKNFQK